MDLRSKASPLLCASFCSLFLCELIREKKTRNVSDKELFCSLTVTSDSDK